ncbi:MAG: hypothetical protein HY868_16630 [Chloroflexi bacterium]|nr:hypothetical protein [Chloroflexota bacterium]
MNVRPWDFKGQQNGERINMISLELYDETAGLVRGEMRDGGYQPEKKSDVVATVTSIKKAKFGDGVVMTLKDVQPLAGSFAGASGDGARWTPPASNAPTTRPPEVTTTTADKKK